MPEIKEITGSGSESIYVINPGRSTNEVGKSFSTYLEEANGLENIFRQAAEKYNVSMELLMAIGKAESDFNPNAVSRCGAQGVMQLMPATAASLGVTDSFDARQNIMGGAKYISDLLKKYNGDTTLALAAYNAGMGNVAKYQGIPPFKETQNYVVKVTNYMKDYMTSSSNATRSGSGSMIPVSGIPYTAYKASPNAAAVNNKIGQADILKLNEIFTYQDYERFLELIDNESEKDDQEEASLSTLKY